IRAAPGTSRYAPAAASAGGDPASTVTLPRGAPVLRPATCSRSAVTNRATAGTGVSGSRQAYSAPAPAGPVTAGRTPALSPAATSARSTESSALTQNDTRTTVAPEGSAPHRTGAVPETETGPPPASPSS